MNDLLSKTFSSKIKGGPYVDLKRDSRDLEASHETEMTGFDTAKNLAVFFEEVAVVKDEMDKLRSLLSTLQDANDESKTITKAQALKALRDRMDKDVEQVLRKAKVIKSRLEDLDRANIANRNIPGCHQGSSADRTRISITNSLRKTLKDLMGDFQILRQKMMSEYRETIERRYFTVTGKQADEETVERMIDTGESETFLQNAIREQGKGQIIETIKEIQERHETVMEIEKNLVELHQIFLDMAVLVEAQGEELNNIENAVLGASSFVKRGTENLHTAKKLQRNTRKCTCIAIILLLVVILVVIVPILVKFIPTINSNNNSNSGSTPPPPPPPTG